MNTVFKQIKTSADSQDRIYENNTMRLTLTFRERVENDDDAGRFHINFKEEDGDVSNSTLPCASGPIMPTDGRNRCPHAFTWTEGHKIQELEMLGGKWADLYRAIVEADKIVRSIDNRLCIIQSKEDIKSREDEWNASYKKMTDAFLRKKGIDENYKFKNQEDMDIFCQELKAFEKEWRKTN